MASGARVLSRFYVSHALSTWNSRTFEFAAVLFLAKIFPGTLLYASFYALLRAGAAVLLSSWTGRWVDGLNRLRCVQASVIWQRIPVAFSCLAFVALFMLRDSKVPGLEWGLFGLAVLLACVEKLASITNTVSIERDWVIVISNELGAEREDLNAVIRRIDLVAKLLAPVFVSIVDEYSTSVALWVVFGQNILSAAIEHLTIAQVYQAVLGLSNGLSVVGPAEAIALTAIQPAEMHAEAEGILPSRVIRPRITTSALRDLVQPWVEYYRNTAMLGSLSLSILYLTVLSTGVQMQAYLFTLGFNSIEVSLMRFAAVIVELLATWAAPILMRKIGPVRAALWFINEQLVCIGMSVALYLAASADTRDAGFSLIGGVTFSRLGLWGFDLCVQYLIQEETPAHTRGQFSSTEMALQNLFELLSFGTTVVFARPEQFKFPVIISSAAVAVSAFLFAFFVRKRRGHLFHVSPCFVVDEYEKLPQDEATARAEE
ncbi:uncharacterized protein PHACADRAFT_212379 [Phanerochaete carnosa HHB-10118-sp]|uniref:Solute carrier family 40 member n=1 Tax=Phanerochaete carnosa (strain HHB-10118-sp) TaxID=650164 RepID=K5UPN7_PHACS|nr:uncharacterized protein PHACADRAFT_212379 [Phanerochaete carnosa HHB-10118-sp]EKM51756.1 hypothetical protein PHACADRAFT_212379 [Phanerochaete carnosa HHB-10118-sp]